MSKYRFSIVALLVIVGMLTMYIVKEKPLVSSQEQRPLQQVPEWNKEAFKNGDYQHEWEQFAQDQMPFRASLFKAKTKVEYGLGKRVFDDVIIGKKDMLFSVVKPVSKAQREAKEKAIKTLSKKHPEIKLEVMIIPTKEVMYPDRLSLFYQSSSQAETLKLFQKEMKSKKIKVDDTIKILQSHIEDGIYYRSDHHWTTDASYAMFQATHEKRFAKEGKWEYQKYVVSDDFDGSQAKRSGYYTHQKDEVSVYLLKEDFDYIVKSDYFDGLKTSVYDASKASSSNPYEVFFGNNYPRIDITTECEKDRHLLVIKDSYANCYVPFLLPYYHSITMVDPRYYQEDIEKLIDEEGIDEILILYNYQTFFEFDAFESLWAK